MRLTNQQHRDLYKKLPSLKRAVIASPEFSGIIDNIAKNNSLDKTQHKIMAEAVVDLLMEINDKESTQTIISNSVGADGSLSQKIFGEIENKVLNNLDNIYQEIIRNLEKEETEIAAETGKQKTEPQVIQTPKNNLPVQPQTQPPHQPPEPPKERQDNVGSSFEEAILNQARAMRSIPAVPNNLPVSEKPPEVHNYKPGSDPYREPPQ